MSYMAVKPKHVPFQCFLNFQNISHQKKVTFISIPGFFRKCTREKNSIFRGAKIASLWRKLVGAFKNGQIETKNAYIMAIYLPLIKKEHFPALNTHFLSNHQIYVRKNAKIVKNCLILVHFCVIFSSLL